MKSSILKEAINSVLLKRLETVPESEWGRDSYRHEHSTEPSSSNNSVASSNDSTPSGSNSNSRKNSEEAKPSTLKKKSRFMFYSTNLVEHRIVQPGSSCLPFPWTHSRDEKWTSSCFLYCWGVYFHVTYFILRVSQLFEILIIEILWHLFHV